MAAVLGEDAVRVAVAALGGVAAAADARCAHQRGSGARFGELRS